MTTSSPTTEVKPFRGILYSRNLLGQADDLIAPPYDNISPAQKAELLARHPNNVVRLILPPGADDGNWHATAAKFFGEWTESGILVREKTPAIYLYEQEFDHNGRTHRRRGFIALKRLEERGQGGTIPHERTFDGPKADRLKLMRAVPANLSPIFVIYSDAENEALCILDSADPGLILEAKDNYGARHRLIRVTNPAAHSALREVMATRRLLIADGHHRFETAMNYRDEMREKEPDAPADAPWNYQMMFFSPMEDPGLLILPWHRAVAAGPVPQDFLSRLAPWFEAVPVPGSQKDQVIELLAQRRGNQPAFAVYRKGGLTILQGRQSVSAEMESIYPNPAEAPLRSLDVGILHRLVIERGLGFSEGDAAARLQYIRSPKEAMERTDSGEFALVLFINPTPVQQVMEVANAGLRMPHKSTDFFPKLLTGMVMNPLR